MKMVFKTGNILKCNVEALVNPVNCVGVMGKGLALQFKNAFSGAFNSYVKVCNKGLLILGDVHIHRVSMVSNPKFIINFPTKRHWKDLSNIGDIADGLLALKELLIKRGIQSVAIPPLGCGLGGLNWLDVKPLIVQTFKDVENLEVIVFEPI